MDDSEKKEGLLAVCDSDGVTYVCAKCEEPVGYNNGIYGVEETVEEKSCRFCGNGFYDNKTGWEITDAQSDISPIIIPED